MGFAGLGLLGLIAAGLLQRAPAAPTTPTEPALAVATTEPVVPDSPPALRGDAVVHVPSAGLAPTILIRAHVLADGTVDVAEVQSPRPQLALEEAKARETVLHARYTPAVTNGKAADAWVVQAMRFVVVPTARTLALRGSISMGGALGQAWVHGFEATHPGLTVDMSVLGSNTAFAALLEGQADVGMSTRSVTTAELSLLERTGVTLREFVVGYDGIGIIAHPDTPVQALHLGEVGRLFGGITPALPGLTSAPLLFARPTYSGTYTSFRDHVLGRCGAPESLSKQALSVESPIDLVAQVAKHPGSFGFLGLRGLDLSAVRVLPIAPCESTEAIAPTDTDIRSEKYPLSRPLYLYLRGDASAEARDFVDFVLSDRGQAIVREQGFVDVPPATSQPLRAEPQNPPEGIPHVLRVYFGTDVATVDVQGRIALDAVLPSAREASAVLVLGNADSAGDATYNRTLALTRAEQVSGYLRLAGVAASKIHVAATDHPIASNASSTGRDNNRRVDVVVVSRPGPKAP
jgi:phosphate transport system substrate-binding protein